MIPATTAFLLLAAAAFASPSDSDKIGGMIRAGSEACLAGDAAGAAQYLDPEFTMSFLASPIQDRSGMIRDYQNLCRTSGANTLEASVPEIDDVSVGTETAVVRLRWSTHLRGAPPEAVRHLGEMQVWRRTADGWRLWRSARWPLAAPK